MLQPQLDGQSPSAAVGAAAAAQRCGASWLHVVITTDTRLLRIVELCRSYSAWRSVIVCAFADGMKRQCFQQALPESAGQSGRAAGSQVQKQQLPCHASAVAWL